MTVKRLDVPIAERLLLGEREAASLCNMSLNFFRQQVELGVVPEPRRIGRRNLYSREMLEEWARSGVVVRC